MSSKTELYNSALVKIGEQIIASPTDTNLPARTLNAVYNLKRRELLRSYQWNFAITRVALAPDATAPAFGFANRFQLPADSVKVLGLYDEADAGYRVNYSGTRIPYKIEGKYALADENPLYIFYVKDVTSVPEFDPMFFEALAWLLAIEIAVSITNDPKKVEAAVAGFTNSIKQAKSADAMEGTPEVLMATEWLDSRFGLGMQGPYRVGPISW